MILKDIIEGFFVLRELKRRGFVEEDGLSMKEFINLVFTAENNVKEMTKQVRGDVNEDK